MRVQLTVSLFFLAIHFFSCKNSGNGKSLPENKDSAHSCIQVPSRFAGDSSSAEITFSGDTSVADMVLIPGGTFEMGGDNGQADADEFPKHRVTVSPFYIDETEVTNAQFQKFVDATGHITTAEKKPDWEEIKIQPVVYLQRLPH